VRHIKSIRCLLTPDTNANIGMSVDAEPLSDRKLCLSVQNSGLAEVGLLAGHNLGLKCLHTQLSRNVYMMLKQVKNLDNLAD